MSDFLDVIVSLYNVPSFLLNPLYSLDGPTTPNWQVLDWYNLLESSPTLAALLEGSSSGWVLLNYCLYGQINISVLLLISGATM